MRGFTLLELLLYLGLTVAVASVIYSNIKMMEYSAYKAAEFSVNCLKSSVAYWSCRVVKKVDELTNGWRVTLSNGETFDLYEGEFETGDSAKFLTHLVNNGLIDPEVIKTDKFKLIVKKGGSLIGKFYMTVEIEYLN